MDLISEFRGQKRSKNREATAGLQQFAKAITETNSAKRSSGQYLCYKSDGHAPEIGTFKHMMKVRAGIKKCHIFINLSMNFLD